MTLIFLAAFSIVAFLVSFEKLGLIAVSRNALSTARAAGGVMRDTSLDDFEKEAAVRKAAVDMLVSAFSIVFRSGIAVIAALLPLTIAALLEIVPLEKSIAFMERLDVIAVASLIVIGGYYLRYRYWQR